MFRVNWRPHPAELMRPGVNFGVPVGWGLRWCSDVYPRLRATAAGISRNARKCKTAKANLKTGDHLTHA